MANIHVLQLLVDNQPFIEQNHDNLINHYKLQYPHDIPKIYHSRITKNKYFLFQPSEINSIIEELNSIPDQTSRNELLDQFYSLLVQEYPLVQYWSNYLDFCRAINHNNIEDIFIRALNDTVNDFGNSHVIWQKTLAFFTDVYIESKQEDDLDRLWKLYIKRISYPHKTLDDSFGEISAFVSAYFQGTYETTMSAAQKIYRDTQKQQQYYEKHEIIVSRDPNDHQGWCDYINNLSQYGSDFKQATCVFYRSLLFANDNWIPVWVTYIYNIYTRDANETLLEKILPKFVRTFPNSCVSYAELIGNLLIFEGHAEMYRTVRFRIDSLDLMLSMSYDDWKVLALAILAYQNRTDSPYLYNDIETFFKFALTNNDMFHSVEKLAISIYESRKQIVKAKELLTLMVEQFKHQSDLWVFAFEFYKRHNYVYNEISGLFKQAIEIATTLDWPERIIQEQLGYELVYGDRVLYQRCLVIADKLIRELVINDESQNDKRSLDEPHDLEESPKRRKLQDNQHRNREQCKVKVSNLPSTTTESELGECFRDCGNILDIYIYQEQEKYEAVIEFEDSSAVFAALTKTYKKVGSNEIYVERLKNCIIWVTNYPPRMTKDDIMQMFGDIGIVVQVRMPIQNSQKVRRFCYVEFTSAEHAQLAVSRYNGKVVEEGKNSYKLIVKISDGGNKKNASVFKREVYISNLDFHATKAEIEHWFQQFGSIENVVLPLAEQMRQKAYNNGGFGFVVFKSLTSVLEALKYNGKPFKGRPINIHVSKKPKQNLQQELNTFKNELTIMIKGIDNTTTKDQIKTFIENKGVLVKRVMQLPEQEAAAVEFHSIADTGKASLVLERAVFGNNVLVIEPFKQVTHPKQTQFVPTSVQRRK